jgi:thiosulfate/3-mercaptopyruvate sulfurtransferase
MNGGRAKWMKENRPMTKDVPHFARTNYHAHEPTPAIRAFRDDVYHQMEAHLPLVDGRSPQEFSGELLHMPNYPQEGAQRGGHIPTAVNIPWSKAVNDDDGTFKGVDELHRLYMDQGVSPEHPVIAYCRIGERSSHTWFVLRYLLGYANVKNYDGSWTEWATWLGRRLKKEQDDIRRPERSN